MLKDLINIRWGRTLIYILPLCYLFTKVIEVYATGDKTDGMSSGRAGFIFAWLIVTFLMCKRRVVTSLISAAFIFTVYAILRAFTSDTCAHPVVFTASLIIWPWALLNGINLKLNSNETNFCAICMGVTCNIMAFQWDSGRSMAFNMALMNTIYYVLSAYIYLFLIRRIWIKVPLMIYPFLVLIQSNKTTVVVITCFCTLYFIYNTVKSASFKWKWSVLTICLVGLMTVLDGVDMHSIFSSASDDFNSGGTGRTEIWGNALTYISRASWYEIIFGYGAQATPKLLHIGAHNDLLEIWLEYGSVGFVLYLYFCFRVIGSIKFLNFNIRLRNSYIMSLAVFVAMTCVSKLVGTQIQFLLITTIWGLILSQGRLPKHNVIDRSHNNLILT